MHSDEKKKRCNIQLSFVPSVSPSLLLSEHYAYNNNNNKKKEAFKTFVSTKWP